MIFGFICFWPYIAFRPVAWLIGIANIPEETQLVLRPLPQVSRNVRSAWPIGVDGVPLGCFPFLGSHGAGVSVVVRGGASGRRMCCLANYVDLYWTIMPRRISVPAVRFGNSGSIFVCVRNGRVDVRPDHKRRSFYRFDFPLCPRLGGIARRLRNSQFRQTPVPATLTCFRPPFPLLTKILWLPTGPILMGKRITNDQC